MKSFIFVVGLLIANFAFAEGDHSEDVCSSVNPAVCAHLGHMTKVSTSEEVRFVAHVMTPQNAAITNFKLDLWMDMGGHGHGSSPVKITPFAVNKYRITDAYFVMAGRWLVRMTFDFEGQAHSIQIPVIVEE